MIEIKNIEWEDERLTLPRSAGKTALHVMSLLDGELCHTQEDTEEGPSVPKVTVSSVLPAFFAMAEIIAMADEWFQELERTPFADLIVPTGHAKYPGHDNDLIVLGIGKKSGAISALCRDLRAVKMLYERFCEVPSEALPNALREAATSTVFACLGLYFVDLMIEDHRFREIHLMHACECLAIASLNRVGDEAETIVSSKRRAAASLRWKRDPTQKAKAAIRAKWESWWVRKEVRFKNDEEFGRLMHRDFPEYESERSIANLSRKWKREIA